MRQWWRHVWEKFVKPLNGPWGVVRRRPFHFLAWLLVVPGVGLAGFWLPLMLGWARGEEVMPFCARLLSAGTTASACVAILAEGLLAVLTAEKTGSNVPALGLRGIAGGLATLLIILLVGILGAESAFLAGPHLSSSFHIVLTVVAMLAASYLYCFRDPTWEPAVRGVDEARAKEELDIDHLSSEATAQSAAGEVRL